MDFASRRRDGYLRALRQRGLEADSALMSSDEMTESYGFAAAAGLLARPTRRRPSWCRRSSWPSACAARSRRRACGWAATSRSSPMTTICAICGTATTSRSSPRTRSSVRDAGRRSAEMLLDTIQDPGQSPRRDLLEAELMVGQSTGPAAGRSPGAGQGANSMNFTRADFPDGFLFGTATSAYQIEGHAYRRRRADPLGHFRRHARAMSCAPRTARVACDHYHRWAEDLDLMPRPGSTSTASRPPGRGCCPRGAARPTPRGSISTTGWSTGCWSAA